MEGGGEGMVAVVHGTNHALTVTLLSDSHGNPTRKCFDTNTNLTRVSLSNVETNTERNLRHVNVPTSDIRYASSNRNIQYPDYESPYVSTTFPQPMSSIFRSQDLFSQSLRKYPNEQSSAELIQRIINYTRTKNDKNKRFSRSLRSVIRTSRSQTEVREDSGAIDECGERFNQILSPNEVKDLSQNELVNYAYDYLKCSSLVPRQTDVRYFTEVKKAIRDRLGDIICNKPKMCPRIQGRYCRHRQRYHKKSASSAKDLEIQATSNRTVALGDASGPIVVRHTTSYIVNRRSRINPCICNRLLPLDDEILNRHEPEQNLPSNLNLEQNPADEVISQTNLSDSRGSDKEIFENVINEWLKTIPVNYNLNEKETLKREQLIHNLIKTLNILKLQSDFPELSKREIIKCLDVLPMWHPDDSETDFILKCQIADDLVKRLINVAEENFKNTISEEVKKLPFNSNRVNDKMINKTIDKFIDKLTQLYLNSRIKDEDCKDKLKLEVIALLKDLPLQSDSQKSDQVLKLADKFVKRLHQYKIYPNKNKQNAADIENNEIEKKIYNWCNELIAHKCNKNHYSDLVKCLAKNFQKYQSNDSKNISVQQKLQDKVKEWLDQLTTRINIKLTPEIFDLLSKDVLEKTFSSDCTPPIGNTVQEDAAISTIFQCITDWYRKIPGLPDSENDDIIRRIKELTFNLNNIRNRDDNLESILCDMKNTILKWLQNILHKNAMKLDSKVQDNLINNLLLKLVEEPDQENNGSKNIGLYKDVITWLKEVPLTKSYDFDKRNNLAGEFLVRLMDIEKTSDEEIIKDNIEEEIKKLVNKLSQTDDKHISPDDIEKLKLKVFTPKDTTSLRRKLWNKRRSNLKKTLYDEISDIVDSCPLLLEKLKPSLKHKIMNVVLRNIKSNTLDIDKTTSQVSNILKEVTTLLKNDIEMLGKQIGDRVNNVLLRHESLHISPITEELNKLKLSSEIDISQESSSIETDVNTDKDRYNTKSQNNKSDNLNSKSIKPSQNTSTKETMHSNHERVYVTNVESETRNTYKKLKSILQKPTSTFKNYETQTEETENHFPKKIPIDLHMKNYNKKENSKLDESLSKDTSIMKNINRAAKSLGKKIEERMFLNKSQMRLASHAEYTDEDVQTDKGINTSFLENDFLTSTPLTSSINYPSLMLLSTVNNSFATKTNDVEIAITDTLQYLNRLEEIVAKWMCHLPLVLNENDKHELIFTIANDILDRQKYIQLSNINTVEQDELEHLKYQIYKRILNLDNREVILDIMSNVDCLNHRILSLKAPNLIQLMQEPEIQETIDINLSNENNKKTNIEESTNKIGEWFEKFFPDFINNFEEDKIEILARNLENLRLNNKYNSVHIKKEIFQWISSFLNDIDIKKLCDLAESLKKHLCDTDTSNTFILKQDTSEFVTENLSGAIIEWIRTTQYRYKLQNEIQDYFAMVLANDIKHVIAQSLPDDEINKQLIYEIMKDLASVTGETNHSAFHYAIACDLLQFLKELKLFHNLSERETLNEVTKNKVDQISTHIDDVEKVVVEWFSMMFLQENLTVKQTEDILKNIADIIKDSELEDILDNESILKHHILKVLSRVPFDKQDLKAQVASLITKLKDILSQKQPLINKMTRDIDLQVDINQMETPSLVYKQLLHETVSKTFLDKLALEEQLSFNLMKEKLADAFIDLHYNAEDNDFRNNFKNKLYKEISKFCDDYLKRSPASTMNTNTLQEDLDNLLKNVSFPTIGSQTSLIRKEQEENQRQRSDFVEGEREIENTTIMTTTKQDAWTQSTPQVSPTSLSLEDIEHLQRIRTRSESQSKSESAEKIIPINSSLNHYEDIGIKTRVLKKDNIPKSVQTSNASVTNSIPIRREISPQVLIREYYWDSSRSNQSFQILEPTKVLQQKEYSRKTKIMTTTQTEPILDNENQSLKRMQKLQEPVTKEIAINTETQTEDLQQKAVNKSRYMLQPHLLDDIPELQSISPQDQHHKINDTRQPLSKRRERTDQGTNRIFEKETTDHAEAFNNDRRKFNQPKSTTTSDTLPPIIITEKRSERRVYASPECMTHDNRDGKICCNCKNHLLTQCRNQSYAGCRQVPAKNTLRHCPKCFGGYCPHPSYFFFKKNF